MEEAEWFVEHTPYPFKTSYCPPIVHVAGLACRYLQKLAQSHNENATRELVNLTVDLAETLSDLLADETASGKTITEQARFVAERLPYWPMLYFRNTAANNHFPRIADRLGLGEKCYLNVSGKANYSLQTPINRFVWKCLRHFQKVHDIIEHPYIKGMTIQENLAHYVFSERPSRRSGRMGQVGMIHREEIPVYERSHKLPPLTKANAERWADVAIMPYVKIRFPDLRSVQELKAIKTGKTGKRYAPVRKAVIQALRQVARKP